MEHQPFRMWLVDRSNLNEDEEEILRNHLAACTECAALEKDLAVADQILLNSPPRIPREGFTRRFLVSLPERRQQEQMRQVKIWMIGIFLALVVNFTLIVAASIYTRTTTAWLVNLAVIYGSLLAFLDQSSLVLHTVSLVIPQQVWIPLVIIGVAWGIAGAGLWVWTMRRILFSGATNEA
jgi:anti-sigma factor RsiW